MIACKISITGGWETGAVCPCCLLLQLTASHFAHLRFHQQSSCFCVGAQVSLATQLWKLRSGKKHLSFLRVPCRPSWPLCHHSFQPSSYKPVSIRGLQPVFLSTPRCHLLTVHQASSHSKCTLLYVVHVAKHST